MFIFAHRGSKGTHPENTLAAFREAIAVGADGIEFDVHLTSDGEMVIIHDEKLNRTTTGKGYVKDYTLAQLKQVDAGVKFSKQFKGERIPTLREVFELVKDTNLILNIELKNDVFRYEGMEEKVVSLIKDFHFEDRVLFSSFNHDSIALLQELAPHIPAALLYQFYDEEVVNDGINKKGEGLHLDIRLLEQEMVQQAHQNGLPVRVWTVNKEKDIQKMMNYDVDAIFSDFPKRALEMVKAAK
ncbi:MAG: glycerophosphodiester phosphodiesterase [Bacillaceae bacterium]